MIKEQVVQVRGDASISTEYRRGENECEEDGSFRYVFMGQCDEANKPNGFCRLIDEEGTIHEGMYTPAGRKDGWHISFNGESGLISLGVYKDNKPHGQILDVDPATLKIMFRTVSQTGDTFDPIPNPGPKFYDLENIFINDHKRLYQESIIKFKRIFHQEIPKEVFTFKSKDHKDFYLYGRKVHKQINLDCLIK